MSKKAQSETTLFIEFDDNKLLSLLFGGLDRYLKRIEEKLTVSISARGNQVAISGDPDHCNRAQKVLFNLYDRLDKGLVVSSAEVDNAILSSEDKKQKKGKQKEQPANFSSDVQIQTPRKVIGGRTKGQAEYIQRLKKNTLVFACGPAGTGKTYIAVAMGVYKLINGEVDRIILSRPAVEAGEQLGFLPGDLREKVDPYLRPLYDALYDMLPADQVEKRIASGEIEIAPLAFMRGRTLGNAFVILDEAQNTISSQMKMFLTRLGERSQMVITGDLTQVDLPVGVESGLRHAIQILQDTKDVDVSYLTKADVVRHKLVRDIIEAYDGA